jgi:hypothetical protein
VVSVPSNHKYLSTTHVQDRGDPSLRAQLPWDADSFQSVMIPATHFSIKHYNRDLGAKEGYDDQYHSSVDSLAAVNIDFERGVSPPFKI